MIGEDSRSLFEVTDDCEAAAWWPGNGHEHMATEPMWMELRSRRK
jgi:hypothetical protein